MSETYTTCRDLALKLSDAGVPVRSHREGGVLKWFYPAWAGRAQHLLRASGLSKRHLRVVLSALSRSTEQRDALRALEQAGDASAIRAFLVQLAG